MGNMSRVLEDEGKLAEAEAMMRQTLAIERRVLGDDHPSTTLTMNNLAVLLANQARYDEAEALHREALERRKRSLPAEAPDTLQSMYNLSRVLMLRGRYAEAEPLLREAIEKRRKVLGELHPYTLGATGALARLYIAMDRFADAKSLLARLCEPDVLSKQSAPDQAGALAGYGQCLMHDKQFTQAEPLLIDAHQRLANLKLDKTEVMRTNLSLLAELCDQTNRPQEAAKWRAELKTAATSRSATAP
jgi:tetratricopeptide (TPR) repeat protein